MWYTRVHRRASLSRPQDTDIDPRVATAGGSHGYNDHTSKGQRRRRHRYDTDAHHPRWMTVLMLVFFFLVGMGVYQLFHPGSHTVSVITMQPSEIEKDTIPDFPEHDPLTFEFDYEKLEREEAEEEALGNEPIVVEEDENGEFILPEGMRKEDLFYTKVMEVAEMGNFEEQNLYLSLLIMTDVLLQHMPICIFTERVLLISNVASESEHAESNYVAFGILLEEYQDRGLDIFAFPCNEFGDEPGTDDDILRMVNAKYSPRLFVMAKMLRSIADNDLFRWLRARTPEDDVFGRGPILENFRYVQHGC